MSSPAGKTETLIDRYQRHLNYLRVSITDRCNLNCRYCRPSGCTTRLSHDDILSYEEILRVLAIASRLGVTKIRITGGEPLVRQDAALFIKKAASLPGITDLSLTTNGVLLKENLPQLMEAGITRLNISLDTLNADKFAGITGRDRFGLVRAGIAAALAAGLAPVKLNMVVMKGINDDEIADFARLTMERPLHIRFIEYMPTRQSPTRPLRPEQQIQQMLTPEIKHRLESRSGPLIPLAAGEKGNTAERFRLAGAEGEIGFISPASRHFCDTCNRLRLTADGRIKPCLLSNKTRDIKTPLRAGKSDEALCDVFRNAVLDKPGFSRKKSRPTMSLPQEMSAIGG